MFFSQKQRNYFQKKHPKALLRFGFLVFGLLLLGSIYSEYSFVEAAAGINKEINFQGKVVNTNGTNVTDGSYTFVFKLYTASSGGVAVWTDTETLTVTDGIFQYNLGSDTSNAPLPGSVDFSADTIYLGVEFNSDGEMAPRVRFTAAPYAFNAEKVNGLTVTQTTGTLTIANGETISFGGSFSTSGTNDVALTTSGATTLTLPTTGTLSTLAGTETFTNKTIGSTGLTFSGATTDITTASGEDLTLVASGAGIISLNDSVTISGTTTLSDLTAGGVVSAAAGTGILSVGTLGASSITADSLDFTEFQDQLDLDASTDILADGSEVFSITNTGTGNSFLVNDEAGDTTPFVIDASGNVGIGMTSPGARFHTYLPDGSLSIFTDPRGTGVRTGSIQQSVLTDPLTAGTAFNIHVMDSVFNFSSTPTSANFNNFTPYSSIPSANSTSMAGKSLRTINNFAIHAGSGVLGALIPYSANASYTGSGDLTDMIIYHAIISKTGSGILTNAYGFQVNNITNSSGTITNTYGIYVGDITTGTQTNTPYSFYASDASSLNYLAGNLGIGDTSPSALLTVGSGDLFQVNSSGAIAAATGITSSGTITFSGLTAGGVVSAAAGTGILSVGTLGASAITADSLDFTEFQDQLDLDASTDILADGSEVLSITNTGTGNSFLVNDEASDTTPFVIDASGNVGIGLSSPTAKLHVSSDTTSATGVVGLSSYMDINPASAASGSYINYLGTGVAAGNSQSFSTARLYGVYVDSYYEGTSTLGFGIGVGAATTNASTGTITNGTALELAGSNTNASGTIASLKYANIANLTNAGTITNTYGLYIGDLTTGTQTNQAYSIYASDSGTRNYLAGNLGIGDTSPSALLTVGSGDLFQVNSSGAIAAATGITSSGTITFSGLTADRLVTTTTGGALTTTITAANLASSVTGTTGSGDLVFATSPTIGGTLDAGAIKGGTAAGSTLTLKPTSNASPNSTAAILLKYGNNGVSEGVRLAGDTGYFNVGGDSVPDNLFSVGATSQFQINSSGAIAAATGITSSGTITFSGLTADRLVTTTTGGALTTTITAANLASSVTGTTGSGDLVFATSPTLTTPNLGTPSTIDLINATNLSLVTGVTGILDVTNGGTGTNTAFTEGSLVFAGTSGVYSEDNTNLFWDDTNNRLGMGTTSPESAIHIGALTLDTTNLTDPVVYIARTITNATSAGQNSHGYADSSNFGKNSTNSSYNSYDARTEISAHGTASGVHYAGFQARPILSSGATLDQYRMFAAQPDITNASIVNEYFSFRSNPAFSAGTINTGYAFYANTMPNTTTAYGVYVVSDKSYFGGIVGIGTTAPDGRLDVERNANSNTSAYITNTSSGTNVYSELNLRNDTGTGASAGGLRLTTFGTGFTTSGRFVQDSAIIEAASGLSGGLGLSARNTGIIFYTNGNSERARFDSSTGYFNVGGDTSPDNLLSVGSTSQFQVNSSGAIAAATGITSSGNYVQSAGTFSLTSANTTQVTTSSALVVNANALTTGTGLYAASSTLTSGKLFDLQVSGTAAAASQTALNILTTGANGTAGITTYGAQISNTHSTNTSTNVALLLNASGGATANYSLLTTGGNVGIGDSAPAELLSLAGGRIRIDNDTNTTNKGCIQYNGSTNELQYSNDCTTFQSFAASAGGGWTDDGTVVRLTTSTDQVAIGTASPAANDALTVAAGAANRAVVTSDLTSAARSTYALAVTQANDATNDNSVGLLQLNNADTASTAAVLNITQAATAGTGMNFTSLTGGTSIQVANTSGTALNANSITTGTGITTTALTTGKAVVAGLPNGATTASAVSVTSNAAGITADYTGAIINIAPTMTHTAATTRAISGNFLKLTRTYTTNGASSTTNITGALAALSSSCTQTLGTCTDSSNILTLSQSYSTSSGTVFTVTGAGTGNLASLDASNSSANGVLIDIQSSSNSQYALNVTTNNGSTNALRVTGDGRVGLGDTTPDFKLDVETDAASGYAAEFFNDGNVDNRYGIKIQGGADDASGTTYYIDAYDGDGGQVGYIANTAGTFALTDVSDVRTKTNITDTEYTSALETINNLRVVDFNRKADPEGPRITGFIAQEVQSVYPYAVTEGKTGYLGVMKDAFVPLLVKAVQEQSTITTTQGASLETLTDIALPDLNEQMATMFDRLDDIETDVEDLKNQMESLADNQGMSNEEGIFENGISVNGLGIFTGLVSFVDDVVFEGKVTFDKDSAGQATVESGESQIKVIFANSYPHAPVVTVTANEKIKGSYYVTDVTESGFTIQTEEIAPEEIRFSWHAVLVSEE